MSVLLHSITAMVCIYISRPSLSLSLYLIQLSKSTFYETVCVGRQILAALHLTQTDSYVVAL